MALSAIELFSGTGMLGEGVRAGLRYLGIEYRTVVHVEREAYAASVLAARMEEESMDDAPIWSDVCTFDARAWRGKVDIVVAGFPCQDLSIAGRRAGLDGKRSGLFFEVVRIATDSDAQFMLLENVRGISSATASVMDEAEGALEERAAARVVGELADCGWDSEWIVVSASDVGASHDRARWFCLAWRMDDAARDVGNGFDGKARGGRRVREAGHQLGDTGLQHVDLQQRSHGAEHPRAGFELGHTKGFGRHEGRAEPTGQQGRHDAAEHGSAMADPSATGWGCAPRGDESRIECVEKQGRARSSEFERDAIGRFEIVSGALADAGGAGSQIRGGGGKNYGSLQQTERTVTWGICGLFAPGPSDQRWAGIIASMSWLAPALSIEQEYDAAAAYAQAQSELRRVADGLAPALDFVNRAAQLKCVGNGVVPLCAATAFVVLARRAGIIEWYDK
jgi:DNA (cytosine-5)-methyltransferase 1